MFDLHTHSLLSDGEMLPSELARRYEAKGFKAIAITDHVDASNIKIVVPAIVDFCKKWPKNRIKVIPGIELTHIPLEHFIPLIKYARKEGIKIIVAHGETEAEPVVKGTNRKALSSDIDILAHPGFITIEDVKLAKKRGIFLELTCRKMHNKTNKHVARLSLKHDANLIINSDSHSPNDIPSIEKIKEVGLVNGLTSLQINQLFLKLSKKVAKLV